MATDQIKIGLTGGIGSGKSTVAKVFQFLGVPVYNSDNEAKKIMTQSPIVKQAICEQFGDQSYLSDGSINRQYLAQIIFNDPSKREKINSIVHPAVKEDFIKWSKQQNSKIVLFESALLFQSITKSVLNYIFAVSANEETRIQRVMHRDQIIENDVRRRIENQLPQKEIDQMADAVIFNNTTDLITPQVIELLKTYRNG